MQVIQPSPLPPSFFLWYLQRSEASFPLGSLGLQVGCLLAVNPLRHNNVSCCHVAINLGWSEHGRDNVTTFRAGQQEDERAKVRLATYNVVLVGAGCFVSFRLRARTMERSRNITDSFLLLSRVVLR